MVDKRSWKEFRNSGMLWWGNMILHTFGWAIVLELDDDGEVVQVFPARVKYRGFSEKSNSTGYKRVSQYMKDNAEDLVKEANDEE